MTPGPCAPKAWGVGSCDTTQNSCHGSFSPRYLTPNMFFNNKPPNTYQRCYSDTHILTANLTVVPLCEAAKTAAP